MTNDIPNPSTTIAGKNVVQYEPPVPGMANSTNPAAAIAGPMMSGSLAPYLVTSPPAHRDIKNVMITNGRNELPAAVDLYECEGEEVQSPAESRVEQQRQQVSSGEVPRAEQSKRQHRILGAPLAHEEANEGEDAKK